MTPLKVRLLLVAVSAGAVLVLTACGSDAGESFERGFNDAQGTAQPETVAPPATRAAAVTPRNTSSPQGVYINLLDNSGVYYSSESAAVTVAEGICEALIDDPDIMTGLRQAELLQEYGDYNEDDSYTIVTSAVVAYCDDEVGYVFE